ncbi:MAG TPA: hypothetical protein VK661_08175, partial [Planctomycetota bacterium]|nr:hypothetical protein [Planctomycetota bacterium]
MKRSVALALLALGACQAPQKRVDAEAVRAQELGVVMSLSVQEASQLKTGQWVLYTVRTEGMPTPMSTRIAVVAAEGDRFWIENRTDQENRRIISKIQVDKTGKPLQLWVGELGTTRPTKVYPGKDADGKPIEPPKPHDPDPKTKVEIAKERITISTTGKAYDCTRLTSKATYPDGRETMLVTWCSPEVPFSVMYEGKSYGGVVRRAYGRHTM